MITQVGTSSPLQPAPGTRIAIVGGAGGFGRALVDACLMLEMRVAVLDLPKSLELHEPPRGVEVSLATDASDEAGVTAAFKELDHRWGQLEGLVNLAGFTNIPPVPVDAVALDEWDRVLSGNLRTTLLSCRAALPLLRRGSAPAIVNMASGLAYRTRPGFGPYSAAKAGVATLTKSLAIENAPAVRVNVVAPSASPTEFNRGGIARTVSDASDDWFDVSAYIAATPLNRLCDVVEVVNPILFLLGPGSSFITGQTIHINGGREMY